MVQNNQLTYGLSKERLEAIFDAGTFVETGAYVKRADGGMVGVNVGIPVPIGVFPFCGHKRSFFGDLHCHGKDAFRFYTESKCVTMRWFDEEEMKKEKVDTWDGRAL